MIVKAKATTMAVLLHLWHSTTNVDGRTEKILKNKKYYIYIIHTTADAILYKPVEGWRIQG